MESKYKRTSQEGSVAMPWTQSIGLLEVGSMLLHMQTDLQIQMAQGENELIMP